MKKLLLYAAIFRIILKILLFKDMILQVFQLCRLPFQEICLTKT